MSCFFFRDFIEKEYVGVKQENPSFPILIRECSNVEPKIYARYGKMNYCINRLGYYYYQYHGGHPKLTKC